MKIAGMKRFANLKTRSKILLGMCSPLILLMILGGVNVFSITSIVDSNESVDRTRVALDGAAGLVGSAVDMESGMRGYLLAGKEGYLGPYKNGEKATYERIATLRRTVNDNPRQVERLKEVEKILREWQDQVTEPTIALRREIGDAKTMNDMARLVGEARGKKYFEAFRGQIQTFIDREMKLLKERHAEFESAESHLGNNFATVRDAASWVNHNHEVLSSAARLLAFAVDMQTGMRGFLLAGQEEFLEPYKAGKDGFFQEIKELPYNVDEYPSQVERLEKIDGTIRAWVDLVAEPAIALRREVSDGGRKLSDLAALVSRKEGKKFFDAFRKDIAAFREFEQDLKAKNQQSADKADRGAEQNLSVML